MFRGPGGQDGKGRARRFSRDGVGRGLPARVLRRRVPWKDEAGRVVTGTPVRKPGDS